MEAFMEWLSAQDLSKNSLDQYKSNFKVLTVKAGCDLLSDSQNKIISDLQKLGYKAGTQRTILATAISYMESKQRETNKLQLYRRHIQRENLEKKAIENRPTIEDLPTSNELINHEITQYEEGNYRGFIVLNLLRLLHCGNLDLQFCLVRDKLRANKCENGYNYLVLDDARKQVLVIRRRYQNAKVYGVKRRPMPGGKLYEACNELLGEKDHAWLLITKDGEKVKDEDLPKCVAIHTFNHLPESTYLKVSVSSIKLVKDFHKLKKMSEERGTTLGHLLDYYHTDIPKKYFNKDKSNKETA